MVMANTSSDMCKKGSAAESTMKDAPTCNTVGAVDGLVCQMGPNLRVTWPKRKRRDNSHLPAGCPIRWTRAERANVVEIQPRMLWKVFGSIDWKGGI
jgi:hypothetical protein